MRFFSRLEAISFIAIFFVLCGNVAFFKKVIQVYPLSWANSGFLISVAIILSCVIVLVLLLVTNRYTFKPIAIILVLVSSLSAYFMQTYDIAIDKIMIQNIMETNTSEAQDLINLQLVLYFLFLGLLPAFVIYKLPISYGTFKQECLKTLKGMGVSVGVSLVLLLVFSKFYTSFFRENKPLRFYTNPTFYLYSAGSYGVSYFNKQGVSFKALGEDAKLSARAKEGQHKLTIVVVGEAARADRFSLNGYEKKTNPLLEKEAIINFSNFSSCGTSTAISVPCMFSYLERQNYSDKTAKSTENVLDIIKRAGVSVLWRDNNSDSKGVALRVAYEDFKGSNINTICDEECRDEGMLEGLQTFIDTQKGDILIVLHQMGNHGPAYYKRYPKSFERFTPTCQTNQVEKCDVKEIGNTYDNAILYTDYFLAKTIQFLKNNDDKFQTALVYMSDHGESLGEKGLYLHGIPYFMAPKEQTHIPALMWFGKHSHQRINTEALAKNAHLEYSHDNLFHTLLGLMEIETKVYEPTKDMLQYNTIKENK